MKAIKLQHFTRGNKNSVYKERKKYLVQLGNGSKNYFTDKKQLNAFLTETNLFLNKKLQELNFIFIEAFAIYRVGWFYMDNSRTKKQLNLKQIDDNARAELNNLLKAFDIIVSRTSSPNSNYFTFSHFVNIITSLKAILNTLLELYESKRHTDKLYKINYLIEQVKQVETELKHYPKTQKELQKKLNEFLS
jgi:chaperonin cofactor prefoldin